MRQRRKHVEPRKQLLVSIAVITDRNATAACATLLGDEWGPLIQETGSTKRVTGDLYDEQTAIDLAVSRALEKLAARLAHLGNARVNRAEQEKRRKTRRASRGGEVTVRERPNRGVVGTGKPQMAIADIQEEWGLDAAMVAAERRGVEWPPKKPKTKK